MTNVIPMRFNSNVAPVLEETTQPVSQPMISQSKIKKILDALNLEVAKKKDMTIHPLDIRMNGQGLLVSRDRSLNNYQVTDWALGQLAAKSTIPVKYLRKCPPDLQAVNVNHWLQQYDKEKDNAWLVRTYSGEGSNGIVRGLLSEKYSPFDDNEIMEILHSFFGEKDGVEVKWWHRDEKGFHLRVIFEDLTTTVGTLPDGSPDIHKVGLHIENSEVGAKSLRITPLIWRQICTNGLMGWGRNSDMEIFTQRHIYLKPHEMYGRVAEAIGNALKVGDSALEKLLEAKETPIENPLDVIKKLAEKNKYSNELTEKIQGAFMMEEGNNAFYVVQAFTRASQDLSADMRVGVESDASKILDDLLKKKAI